MKIFWAVLFISLFGTLTLAAPSSLNFQGRILKSDGTPLEYNNVGFLFQVTDPTGTCVLYEEQVNGFNMANSGGVFDTPIGLGTRSWPASGAFTVLDSMNNSAALSCFGGSTYTPAFDDTRKLRVSFYDGVGWKLISPDSIIRSVPYAGYATSATMLGTNVVGDFVLKAGLPTCTTGTFLSWDGSALTCAAVSGTAGGTVTSVTATSPLSVTNGTSTPNITIQAATSSQAGYLTSADWTTFNNKLSASSAFSGDVSGTSTTTSVDKLKGTALSISALSSGQFLKYNGTNWINSSIAQSDVSGLSTTLSGYMTTAAFSADIASAACTTSQTMYWSSVTNAFACQTIAVANFSGALAGDVSGNQGTTSVDKIKGIALSMTGLATNKVLAYDGTNWAPAVANSGTVTSVSSANSYLTVATGTSTPALTLNVGSAANTVAAGNDTRLVNAIQNAGSTVSIQSGLDASLPASSTNGKIYISTDAQKIYRDNGTSWDVVASVGGGGAGSVTSVSSANTDIAVTNGTSTPTLTLNSGTGANQILKLDGSSKIPAVDGSQITNLNPSSLSAVVPVTKGGTGQSSYTDGQILVGNSTGNTLAKQTLSGDVSMTNAGVVTVTGVKGKSVSAAPTAAGQVLRYDGTSWTPNFVGMQDLRSNVTGTTQLASSCASNQTLTYNSASDNLTCTNIAISMSQISSGTLAVANGGTGVTSLPGTFVLNGGQAGTVTLGPNDANSLTFDTSGTAQMTILSSGSVGIGTTTPGSTLDVNGTLTLRGSTSGTTTIRSPASSGSASLVLPASNGGSGQLLQTDGSGNLSWISPSTSIVGAIAPSFFAYPSANITGGSNIKLTMNTLVFDTNSNYSTSTGRYTPSIAGKYLVQVALSCAGSPAQARIFKNGAVINYAPLSASAGERSVADLLVDMNGTTDYLESYGYCGSGASDYFPGGGPYTYAHFTGALIAPLAAGSVAGTGTANYVPYWTSSTTLSNSPMAISSSNVGIGTTTPAAKLEIANGGTTAVSLSGGTPSMWLVPTVGTNPFPGQGQSYHGGIALSTVGGDYGGAISDLTIQTYSYGAGQSNAIRFVVPSASNASSNEVMRIAQGGNVGIGTATPVAGRLNIVWTSASQQGLDLRSNSETYTGSPIVFANSSGATAGFISQATNSVGYNTTSDRRLKENIVATDLDIQDLLQLKVYDYDFISDPLHQKTTGFVAQEVQKIFPDAVRTNGDDGKVSLKKGSTPWAVDYGRITPLIVKAIQDLYAMFTGDHERIMNLEKENAALKALVCGDHPQAEVCLSLSSENR